MQEEGIFPTEAKLQYAGKEGRFRRGEKPLKFQRAVLINLASEPRKGKTVSGAIGPGVEKKGYLSPTFMGTQ